MIGDEHEGSTGKRTTHPAGGIGDDENLDAQLRKHPRREAGDGGRMPLIQMKAACLHDHGDALERTRDQLALMPGDTGLGKTGDGVIRDAD